MKLIDSHFHAAHLSSNGIDVQELFLDLFTGDFGGGIDIGLSPGDLSARKALLADFPEVRFAAGIYPGYADDIQKGASLSEVLAVLEQEIKTEKPAAVGEIGLDWYWNYGSRELQFELAAKQIDMANRYGLPVIIHNRDADDDIIRLLREHSCDHTGIIHCFSSGLKTAEALLEMGYTLSFAGNITYKKNGELRRVVETVPAGQLLLETDSPYLAPVPMRGKVNTPSNMIHIYRLAAEIRNTDISTLADELHDTLRRIAGQSQRS